MIKQRETNSWKSVSYAKSITGAQTYTKFPIVLRTTEQSIPTWSMNGNVETSGTPSPSNPVTVQGVGELTDNLFDLTAWANSITSVRGNGTMSVSGTTVTLTSINEQDAYTIPYSSNAQGVYKIPVKPNTVYRTRSNPSTYARFIVFENGLAQTGYMHTTNGPFTTQADTTYLSIRMGVASTQPLGTSVTISDFMISEGATEKDYKPYGYKIPITNEGENLFDKNNYTFSHLYVAGDNKIYSSDTVCAFILNCEPNTTYTVAKMITSRFILWSMANYPEVGGTFTVREADNTAANLTITTGNDDHYILFMFEYTNSSQEAVTEQVANTVMYNTHTTTPIYLGEVQSYREIKKIEYTGAADESWTIVNEGTANAYVQNSGNPAANQGIDKLICTHYQAGEIYNGNTDTGILVVTNGGVRIRDTNAASMSVSSFKAYLQQQYAAGTPLTVWYVLATASTGIVNEPLMKIGNYADTLSNATSIPTTLGLNTIDVNTTVKPSEMSLTYDGYKICKHKRKSANLFNATVESGAISSSAGTDLSNNERLRSSYVDLAAGTYTLGASGSAVNVFLYLYNTDGSYVGTYSGSWSLYPFTFTLNTAMKCRFVWKKSTGGVISVSDISQIMLNTGGTLFHYAPYWE